MPVRRALLSHLIFLLVTAILVPSISCATDSYLFEKDGFRIHYTGNGGNCNGCEWIAIDGKIPPDAGELFRQYVKKHNFIGTPLFVTFNSNGGSLAGAIRLGRVIRASGLQTSIGKTVPEGRWHTTIKGRCYSACAYAFLGGVSRLVEPGEYGVHQFFTDALLKDPNGRVFSPVDFSLQQTVTGLLLSYVMEMGVSANLVIEANNTPPTEMNLLTKKQLTDYRVTFEPKLYSDWKLEAFRKGIVAYSRSQDEKNQMSIFCVASGRGELLITYFDPVGGQDNFRMAFGKIEKFALLKRDIRRSSIRLEVRPNGIGLHVPLTAELITDLENNKDPYGSFSVHPDEPRVFYGYVYERISLNGLGPGVRLVRRNCIN
jgi:hypothetical protein